MSSKYKFSDNSQLYFVSFAVVYWIDLFTRTEYCKTIFESLTYCEQNKGLELYAYCIMPSHLHLIIGSSKEPLPDIMRDFKSFTSRSLRIQIRDNISESRKEWMLWMMERAGTKTKHNKGFQLWQQDNHPIALLTPAIAKQKLDYLHYNPVEAGFVLNPEDWKYSSARNYMQLDYEKEVIILDGLYS